MYDRAPKTIYGLTMLTNMSVESIAGDLLKVQGWPAVVVAAIALVVLLAIIRFRTTSTHTIFRWLWRLIAGNANGVDYTFDRFMMTRDELNQFRFVIGKARTTAQMHSLIRWSADNNEDIADVSACGPYFDRERPGLKPAHERPTTIHLIGMTLGWSIALLLLLTSGVFANLPGVLLSVTATDTLLLVDPQSTKAVFHPKAKRLSIHECTVGSNRALSENGFSQDDRDVICALYKDPALPAFITENLLVQRWYFGLFGVMFGIICLWLSKRFNQAKAAFAMASRLDRPRP